MTGLTDWDDLRFFLAVARAGSLAAAARSLRVNHATVSRRIQALEQRTGTRLFDRIPQGWTPTAAGDAMQRSAERVEEEMSALGRQVVGRDALPTGTLRVAVSDAAGYALLPELRAFAEAHPRIVLELTASNASTNLTRREADVALRVTANPPEHLVGRRLASTGLAIYGARPPRRRASAPADLEALPWLGFDEGFGDLLQVRWMREHVPDARIVARFDSVLLAWHAVRAGLGVALLPCVLGDRDPDLVRIRPDLVLTGAPLWILTHPDLRAAARVQAFLRFVGDALHARRDEIEGRRPEAWRASVPPARAAG